MSLRAPQLWELALAARREEQVQASIRPVRARHEPARVGDMIGTQRIVEILPRDASRKERVLAECPNGHRRPAYSENLRHIEGCRECRRQQGPRSGGRKYPEVKVGDRFGSLRVVALLPLGHEGRSDERVEVVCPRGHRRESYVFNLREKPRCTRCPRVA